MTPQLQIGDPTAMDPVDRRWAEKAIEREFEALPAIRGLAEKWAASLTSILGVVGLAALLEGADTFDKLDSPWRQIAEWSFIVAAVAALLAMAMAVAAAQGTSQRTFVPGGSALREYAETSVDSALRQLARSRWLAAFAATLVLAAAGCLWLGEEKEGKPTVIEVHGTEFCATLGAAAGEASEDASIVVRCAP